MINTKLYIHCAVQVMLDADAQQRTINQSITFQCVPNG